MNAVLTSLWTDDAGFVISSELVLIATVAVLAMIVGLSEVAHAVNQELEDVASAVGAINQSYQFNGLQGHPGESAGSLFDDSVDFCDNDCDIVATDPQNEGW